MTPSKATEFLLIHFEYLKNSWKSYPDYNVLEAIRFAISAIEKQISKNPYHISQVDDNDNANVECPICHATTDYAINTIKRGYCWKCGQLLDWENT